MKMSLLVRVGIWAALNGILLVLLGRWVLGGESGEGPAWGSWPVLGGLSLGVTVLFWFPFVRSVRRSIGWITNTTETLALGDFQVRVPGTAAERSDELGQLGRAVNHLGERLEEYLRGQRRFMGDVAHELCSPVARIQMALGILEQRADSASRPYVEDVKEEVAHMTQLLNDLLSFSKAGLRAPGAELEPVLLLEVVERAVAREVKAPAYAEVDVPSRFEVLAEPELLERAVANVLRNAVRYAGEAGPIQIRARVEDGGVRLRILDQGPGIQEEALARIFDPFYRTEKDRDRRTGGAGLGLAIVRTCMDSFGGGVECRNRRPHGLEVLLHLRLA